MIAIFNRLETLLIEIAQSEKTALGDYTIAMVRKKIEKIDETLGKHVKAEAR